ncbi:mycothiol transferase [Paramicrobacterium agarici]|uniref:DinB family protein n=1 Tax=Paramicrobacterium agarici TaxID=630514 RepID=A0A2A9DXV3_9MICO|nr:DinB family protein [Microbacterium agarici]PFG31637.1 DinB family protein [Microbacterium agarici]
MNARDILIDAAGRPREAARSLSRRLTPEALNAHPGGHDNSIAWLLWHTGREIDAQTASLTGSEQVWYVGDYARRTGLGDAGAEVGYGHTSEQARAIRTDAAEVLVEYISEATDALVTYLRGLSDDDLSDVIDENWDPPVTRGVRLMSIIDDAAQHVGQAAYAAGAHAAG